jgi:phosphotransferase system  glucose/maltose/N-acetylglucosamine-specific IIC component
MVYMSLKEIIQGFLDELQKVLKEYAQKQEAALKARLKKFIIISIAGSVIMTLAISMAGTAALFFQIGSLRYLETTMPAWEAWMVMAATSALIAVALFTALFLIIKKTLSSPKTQPETKQQAPADKVETV